MGYQYRARVTQWVKYNELSPVGEIQQGLLYNISNI